MKIAIIYNNKMSGKLTNFFTGSRAYHIGFLDERTDTFYDMHWLPRKVSWSAKKYKEYKLYECPVTKRDCEQYLKQDSLEQVYGFKDYLLFALRPIYHFLGKSTVNANGWICSEMVNNWLWRKKPNYTPFNLDAAPPSPADFERWLNGR